ncbi:MAG: hypothetical protein CBC42_05185 [Betaproteobacteria bacterium TMED82]|nr:MAG: hypothetical protein CBC42_05185 [Betaproteobacteria bacterium TMED82]|tara:strand:- start:96579 stop:99119 length:2541 start_codon:yes stop_codon:yes gene_type:complete
MSIESKFLASSYLQSRLANVSDAVSMENAKAEIQKKVSNQASEFSISASDSQYILLKDTVDKNTKLTSLVQVSSDSLGKIGDYLVDIKQKVNALNNASDLGTTKKIKSEITEAEDQLSSYISTVITRASSQNVNLSPITEEYKNTFFDTVTNKQAFSNSEAQAMAEIEVNFAHGIAESVTNHNRLTCPICSQNDANNLSSSGITEGALRSGTNISNQVTSNPEAHAGSTQNNTSVTGASANNTTGTQELDSLMLANKWELDPSETLSYSYYVTSGVAYTYNVNATIDSSAGASYVGTAGASLIGSSDVVTRMDAAFDDWDQIGAWTMEKITESGTTVGEIRSRVLAEVGDVTYSAFAYGPGSNPINGDIWYTIPYSTQFDEGTFNYYTALHEIGHAVGLSHPFDGGGRASTTLADAKDFVRNTVMSYTSDDRNVRFVPDNTANPTNLSLYYLYPTDPGMLDVQVIEHLYGTSTDTNLGDTTYVFDDKPHILKTIVDSGGIDTIDASNQTEEVRINLNGGTASSIGIWTSDEQSVYWRANGNFSTTATITNVNNNQASGSNKSPFAKGWYEGIDNLQIASSAIIENAKGGAKDDTLIGNSEDNEFTGNGGDDKIEGGAGSDIAVFSGAKANYTINAGGGSYTIQDNVGSDGTDTLTDVEIARFSDVNYTLADGSTSANTIGKKADASRIYKPVVRVNLSINVTAFPILAKLNIPSIQAFTRGVVDSGEFSPADAKVLFTDGLKSDAEIQSALDALDELLKQIAEQQAVLATAASNVTQNFGSVFSGVASNSEVVAAGVSQSLVSEVENAGFVSELMSEIRAQIKSLMDAQVAALTNTTNQEVMTLLS